MIIEAKGLEKRFDAHIIFKSLDLTIAPGQRLAILGPNGSGKSTLILVLAGAIHFNSGTLYYRYEPGGKPIDEDKWYRHISIASPGMALPDQLKVAEIFRFYKKFKTAGISEEAFCRLVYLPPHEYIKNLSSGMRQRLKIGLATQFDSETIFMDEPTSHLDLEGIDWYLEVINKIPKKSALLIGSNDRKEYPFCTETLTITHYK